MACDAQSLINAGYSAGYARLSERDLMECIVASSCISGSLVSSGVGVPTADPGVANSMYTDTATGTHYWWYLGGWHL